MAPGREPPIYPDPRSDFAYRLSYARPITRHCRSVSIERVPRRGRYRRNREETHAEFPEPASARAGRYHVSAVVWQAEHRIVRWTAESIAATSDEPRWRIRRRRDCS